MNQREAKRRASAELATVAQEMASAAQRGYGTADGHRMSKAFTEFAEELSARGAREHGEAGHPADPDQLPLLRNPCCDDTGFADYASVPCPNPTCTAVLRNMVEAGQAISDQAQRLLESESHGQPV